MRKKPIEIPRIMTAQSLFGYRFNSEVEDKAAQLFWDHLTAKQKQEIIEQRILTIKSGCARLRYTMQLTMCNPNSVHVKTPTTLRWRYLCIHTTNYKHKLNLPYGDILLTKKLAFEADPKEFIRIGNS